MKRIIESAVILLFIMGIFYFALVKVFNSVSIGDRRAICWAVPYITRIGGQEWKMFKDLEKNTTNQIVVLGSSHAYRGYDPSIFSEAGIDLFNMGSSSQHPLATWVLLKNFVDSSAASLVIFEVFDKTFELEGMDCTTRLIQGLPNASAAVDLLIAEPDIRTMNAISSRFLSDVVHPEYETPGYTRDGYCSLSDTMEFTDFSIDTNFTANLEMFTYFDRCLDLVEQRNIPYIIVSHPQPAVSGLGQYHRQFRIQLDEILLRHHATYLDWSDQKWLLTPDHFADENHLNQAGVTIFNQRFIQWLREYGYLPGNEE